MIVTNEYVFINPSIGEISEIVEKNRREQCEKKNEYNDRYKVSVTCHFDCFDNLKNKRKKLRLQIIMSTVVLR